MKTSRLFVRITVLAVLLLAHPVVASEQADTGASLGGPWSVSEDLANPNHKRLAPSDLSLGGDYFSVGQWASDSNGEDSAGGGVARFYGTLTLLEGTNGDKGRLIFKVENRHKYSDIAPQELGFEVGYAGLTSITFSDAGWVLTNLYWEQSIVDNRFSYVAGILDPSDYIDIYWLADPWSGFSNLAFSTNPALPLPNQGLGAAARLRFGEGGYLIAGVVDTNGDPHRPQDAFESFFKDAEYFSHVEIGWTKSYEDRFTDNVHLTLWYSDARREQAISSGKGMAFSASWQFGERWVPFLRFGASEGGGPILDRTIAAGTGYRMPRRDDTLGIGINVGRPAEDSFSDGLDEQTTLEVFYRYRITHHFTITPDLQYIRNPAFRDDTSSIWIMGARFRVTL